MIRRVLLLALVAFGLFSFPCWRTIWYFTCYAPIPAAADTARKSANAKGYKMAGWMGTFVSEPDEFGGCEVQFEFIEQASNSPEMLVTIRLRRSWSLGGWEVTEMHEEPFPQR